VFYSEKDKKKKKHILDEITILD